MNLTQEDMTRWLEPMLEACEENNISSEEVENLKAQASTLAGDEVVSQELDMVRFGQLLRDRLRWTDYPSLPAPTSTNVP
jgi:hypothetical protein